MRPATALRSVSPEVAPAPSDAAVLAGILSHVHIDSQGMVRFGDLPPVPVNLQGVMLPAGTHPLTETLTSLIYHYPYARGVTRDAAAVAGRAAQEDQADPDPDFLARLSAANRSRERWDPMWRVYQTGSNGALSVEKRSVHFQALPGSYLFVDSPGRTPAASDFVSVHAPKESSRVQRGFYFAFGETIASEFDDVLLARLYFNATAESVPLLVEWLSTDLNRYRIPYRFKCLANPALYDRRDPAVLYIAKRFLPLWLHLAVSRRDMMQALLRPGTPLFTKPLLDGLGAADEPGGGASFGQSRSRLVAEGIVAAWLAGGQSVPERLRSIAACFHAAGLSLATPHLAEGARDLYQWPVEN